MGSPGEAGNLAETLALQHLQHAGLRLVQRNYRVARGPGARAGEIDLIMRDPDGTIVFVEVRSRAAPAGGPGAARSVGAFGGAAASVGPVKQQRLWRSASFYLLKFPKPPACRFDLVAIDGNDLRWMKNIRLSVR